MKRFSLQLLLARRSVPVTFGIEGRSARHPGERGSRLWRTIARSSRSSFWLDKCRGVGASASTHGGGSGHLEAGASPEGGA